MFFLSVRQKLIYYRYEIMGALITNRSEKVEIKVNPAFYLPLETILRFYFVQVGEKRGSIIWGFILFKCMKQGAQ